MCRFFSLKTTAQPLSTPSPFEASSQDWWSGDGPFRALHALNPPRLTFMLPYLAEVHRVLDVGCGGGLVAEPLARLGKEVTGIDLSPGAIAAAQEHAHTQKLAITYQVADVATLAKSQPQCFDGVTLLELLEHVEDPQALVQEAVTCLRPGGVLLFSTLNRTLWAYALAIRLGEDVLKWAPKGVHNYAHFITPYELTTWLEAAGCEVLALRGLSYRPWLGRWELSNDLRINYIGAARRRV